MKRILFAVVSLVLCAGLANAQSLVDLAKKEKERRKEIAKQGQKAKEFSGQGESDGSSSDDSDESASVSVSSRKSKDGDNDDWDYYHRRYQRRYDSKKNSLASLQRNLKECKENKRESQDRLKAAAIRNGKSYLTDKNYKSNYSCDYYDGQIKSVESAMNQIEVDCAADARKRRILPGRARLQK